MTTIVTSFCGVCSTDSIVEVPLEGLLRWQRGELIQNALPTLSDDERELLISGTHRQCWDGLFTEDD